MPNLNEVARLSAVATLDTSNVEQGLDRIEAKLKNLKDPNLGRLGGAVTGGSGGGSGNSISNATKRIQDATNKVNGLRDSVKSVGDAAKSSRGWLTKMRDTIMAFGTSYLIIQGLVRAFGALKDAVVDFNALLQTSEVGFARVLDNNKARAKQLLAELKKFAIPTPFEMPDLIGRTQQILGFKLVKKEAKDVGKEVTGMLRDIGDAVFGLGRGQKGVDTFILALGQMRVAGKVSARELLMLSKLGVSAWDYLAEGVGKSTREVRKMVTKGEIDAGQAIKAILAGVRRDFSGGMEQASTTFTGAIAKAKDTLRVQLSDATEGPFGGLTNQMNRIADALGSPEFKSRMTAAATMVSGAFDMLGRGVRIAYDAISKNTGVFTTVLRVVKPLTPALYALAAAYAAVRLNAAGAGIAAAFSGSAAAVGRLQGMAAALGQFSKAFAAGGLAQAVPALGGSIVGLGASLVAVTAALGIGAIAFEKYQEKAAIADGAAADLQFTSDQLAKSLKDAGKYATFDDKATASIDRLKEKYDELKGTVGGLQRFGILAGKTRTEIALSTTLKPLEKRLLDYEINRIEKLAKDEAAKLQLSIEADVDVNPLSLQNIKEAFNQTFGPGWAIGVLGADGFGGIKGMVQGIKTGIASWFSINWMPDPMQKAFNWVGTKVERIGAVIEKWFGEGFLSGIAGAQGRLKDFWNWFNGGGANPGERVPGDMTITPNTKPAKKTPGPAIINGVPKVVNDAIESQHQKDLAEYKRLHPTPGIPTVTPVPDEEKERKARERAALKLQKDQLQDIAKKYEQVARAAEDSAKRQLEALKSLQDRMQDLFGGAQEQLLKLGIVDNPLAPIISSMERLLGIAPRAASVVSDAFKKIDAANKRVGGAKSKLDSLNGGDGYNPGYGGGSGPNYLMAMAKDTGKVIGLQCGEAISHYLGGKGRATAYDTRANMVAPNANGTYAPGTIFRVKGANYPKGHYMMVGADGQHWTEANYRLPNGVTTDRPINWNRDINAATWGGRRHIYAPPGSVVPGAGLGGGYAGDGISASYNAKTDIKALAAKVTGQLNKFADIPKEWGKGVKDTADNFIMFAGQMMLADKDFQAFLRIKWGKDFAKNIKKFRQNLFEAQKTTNTETANRSIEPELQELYKRGRLRGKTDGPLATLAAFSDSREHGDAKRLDAAKYWKKYKALATDAIGEVNQSASKSQQQFVAGEMDKQGVLRVTADLLKGAATDMEGYAKAIAMAEEAASFKHNGDYQVQAKMSLNPLLSPEQRKAAAATAQAMLDGHMKVFEATYKETTQRQKNITSIEDEIAAVQERNQATRDQLKLMRDVIIEYRETAAAARDSAKYAFSQAANPKTTVREDAERVRGFDRLREVGQKLLNDGFNSLLVPSLAAMIVKSEEEVNRVKRVGDYMTALKTAAEQLKPAMQDMAAQAQAYFKYAADPVALQRELAMIEARRKATEEAKQRGIQLSPQELEQAAKLNMTGFNEKLDVDTGVEYSRAIMDAKNSVISLTASLEEQRGSLTGLTELQRQEIRWREEDAQRLAAGTKFTAEMNQSLSAQRDEIRRLLPELDKLAQKRRMQQLQDEVDLYRYRPGLERERERRRREVMNDDSIPAGDKQSVIDAREKAQVLSEYEARLMDVADRTRSIISNALSDGFKGGIRDGIHSMLQGLSDMVQSMLMQDIATRISNKIFGNVFDPAITVAQAVGTIGGGKYPGGKSAPAPITNAPPNYNFAAQAAAAAMSYAQGTAGNGTVGNGSNAINIQTSGAVNVNGGSSNAAGIVGNIVGLGLTNRQGNRKVLQTVMAGARA